MTSVASSASPWVIGKSMWYALLEHSPSHFASLLVLGLQRIRVQTASGTVETVTLHLINMGASVEDVRIRAMHHQSPLHSFLFDRDGRLLHANRAAALACKQSTAGNVFVWKAGLGQCTTSLSKVSCSSLAKCFVGHIKGS